MRKKESKGRKKFLSSIFKHKYLSHTYKYSVTGEDLPEERTKKFEKKEYIEIIMLTIVISALFFYFSNAIWVIISTIISIKNQHLQAGQLPNFDGIGDGFGLKQIQLPIIVDIVIIIIAGLISTFLLLKYGFKAADIAYGQKGDSRLMELSEIQDRFKAIPEAGASFPGYGGFPVSHYLRQYFVEDGPMNTIGVGTSRSGKGQSAVLEQLENVSRAEKQSSVVVGDPKGELYAASKDEYEKRGYDVYAYNLIVPSNSMGDDPLSLIKKYYRRGRTEEALQQIKTLTYTLYNDDKAGDNKFFNETAAAVVNAMVIVLLEDAKLTGEWDKVTMTNVSEMLVSLATLTYKKDPHDPLSPEVNALDEYMKNLPSGNLAKVQYGSTSFAGEKAKGSILATVSQGLNPFTLPSVAKLTSKASIDIKSVGFQKYIDFKVSANLLGKKLKVNFWNSNHTKLIGSTNASVGVNGFSEVNFDLDLKTNNLLEIIDEETQTSAIFKITLSTVPKQNVAELLKGNDSLGVESIELNYSERPIAIFLMLPDFNRSNHILASIFISNLYTELSYQCSTTAGNKCFRRVQFILDEFGNLPAIADLDQILTVTNGRNMLWTLYVQAYSQVYAKYGKEAGDTIIQNCQTRALILTTDEDTIESFSKAAGNRTVVGKSSSINELDMNNNVNASPEAERILTFERLSQMLEGETLVINPLHRRNLAGEKVRSRPIFNTKETSMPYAYQFLTKVGFDPSRDINTLTFDSPNKDLDLVANRIDFSKFILDQQQRENYQKNNVV